MFNYRVGVLDDDDSKVIEVIDKLNHAFDCMKEYSKYTLSPVQIDVSTKIDATVEEIMSQNIECMLIDYKLSSFKNAGYTGVEIANELWSHRKYLPVFMLTSYDEDMYMHELFSAFQIFNYDRYLNDVQEQDDIHKKIVREIEMNKKRIAEWERELIELLSHRGESAKVDSRIIELDSELESAIDRQHAIPLKTKQDLSESALMRLVNNLDRLLEGND